MSSVVAGIPKCPRQDLCSVFDLPKSGVKQLRQNYFESCIAIADLQTPSGTGVSVVSIGKNVCELSICTVMSERPFKPNWGAVKASKPKNQHGVKRKRGGHDSKPDNAVNGLKPEWLSSSPRSAGLPQKSSPAALPWQKQSGRPKDRQYPLPNGKPERNGHPSHNPSEKTFRPKPSPSQPERKQPPLSEKRRALLQTRAQLPIASHATDIRLSLRGERDVLLLVGETGSGKSTQVPQFLYGEPWMTGQIAITQPRRVAATSLAKRVAEEMGTSLGNGSPASKVGYSVRFDNNVAPGTKIKFLTEGMLLQELLRDPWLKSYSVVVVDEVHERGVNVDLLLGFLRKIMVGQSRSERKARKGAGRLKVVVMSATAEMEGLWRFFEEGFKEKEEKEEQTMRSARNMESEIKTNGVHEASLNGVEEFMKIHDHSPDEDAASECSWSGISSSPSELSAEYPEQIPAPVTPEELRRHAIDSQILETEAVESSQISTHYIAGRQHAVEILYAPKPCTDFVESALTTILQIHYKEPLPGDILVFLTGQDTVETLQTLVTEHSAALPPSIPPLLALPLYAALPQSAQSKIFSHTPKGTRRVILSTNIAETSVTIPGIAHVIDSGLAKVKEYRAALALDSLLVKPISKSSAIQRKGRAGRERAGKCWRLYTEREYLALEEAATPEILRTDVSSAVLTMKARGVGDIMAFPLLDPIPAEGVRRALLGLLRLGALDESGAITATGRQMARLPLPPMLSRVLVAASPSGRKDNAAIDSDDGSLVRDIIDIISALTAENLFLPLPGEEIKDAAETARRDLLRREGDHLTLLSAVRAYTREQTDRKRWCGDRHISHRAMKNVMDVRKQLRGQCVQQGLLSKSAAEAEDEDAVVTPERGESILRAFLGGFAQNVARLMPDGSYRTVEGNQVVAIHPGSVLFGRRVEAVVFNELVFTSKCYARGVSVVQMGWYGEVMGGK